MNQKNKIIILSGKAQSGKNLTANIIKEYCEKNNKKTIIISYAKYLKDYAKAITNWNGREKTKPREFLQQLGTEIKNNIDEDILINRIKEDIKVYKNYFDTIVISDARFINEIEKIKEEFKNAIVIRIEGIENKLTDKQKQHITETALDNYKKFDYTIENKTTKQNLKQQIKKIMEEQK